MAVITEHQLVIGETDKHLVAVRVIFIADTLPVRHQSGIFLSGSRFEPKFKRIILRIRQGHFRGIDGHKRVSLKRDRQPGKRAPVGAIHPGRSSLRLVGHAVALTVVHRIVGQHARFLSGVNGQLVRHDFVRTYHFVPDTCFVHLTGKIIAALHAAPEQHRPDRSVRIGGLYPGDHFRSAEISGELAVGCLIGHGDVRPIACFEALRFGSIDFSSDAYLDRIVRPDREFQRIGCRPVAEQRHFLAECSGQYPHFDREVFVRQVAFGLCRQIRRGSVEGERSRMVAIRTVAHGCHLEVLHVGHIPFGNLFVEGQADFVFDAQHAVGRLDIAEHDRPLGIFHAGDDRGRFRHELIAYLAERHRADVVLLVFGAIETGRDRRSLDHGLLAGSRFIGNGIVVETANIRPILIGTGRGFVLDLDMVETLEVHIETVDRERHVVFAGSRIERRLRIQRPFVRRALDVDVRRRRDKVSGDIDRIGNDILETCRICLALRTNDNRQVFVIIFRTSTNFQSLLQGFPIVDQNTTFICQRYTVDRKLSSLLVSSINN